MSSKHNDAANATANDHGSGYLEISEKGFGFLRTASNHFHPKPTDIFVTPDTIKRNFLREGSLVEGPTQPPHRGTSPQLKAVDKVNGWSLRTTPNPFALKISRALTPSRNTISKPRPISLRPASLIWLHPSAKAQEVSLSRLRAPAKPRCSSRLRIRSRPITRTCM